MRFFKGVEYMKFRRGDLVRIDGHLEAGGILDLYGGSLGTLYIVQLPNGATLALEDELTLVLRGGESVKKKVKKAGRPKDTTISLLREIRNLLKAIAPNA